MAGPSREAVLHAYRALYKSCLYAVRYSHPSRTVLRDQLRLAFRKSTVADFEPHKIKNTLEFLDGAGREAGIESKMLKALCEVEWWRAEDIRRGTKALHGKGRSSEEQAMIWGPYNATIAMLNESMGMCLPIRHV